MVVSGLHRESSSEKPDEKLEEILLDLVNRVGSFSGESLSLRHGKRTGRHGSRGRITGVSAFDESLRERNSNYPDSNPLSQQQVVTEDGHSKFKQDKCLKRRVNNCFHQYRFVAALFGGLSVGLMLFLRYNITISILKMVNQTHLYLEEHPGKTVEDMIADGYTITDGEFNWNNEIQQMIMSFYMIAYTLPQLPMAKVGLILGCRYTTPISLLICSLATLLTPMFAYFGWEYVILLRLVNGFGAAPVLPMLLSLLENWLREEEIPLGLGLSQSVSVLLLAINPVISGYLSSIHWSLSFYVPGGITIVFCLLWLILIRDRPHESPLISQQELEHIQSGQINLVHKDLEERQDGSQKSAIDAQNDVKKKKEIHYKPNSWTAILKVPSFYAYLVVWCIHCGSANAFNFILPTYLVQILQIQLAQNGLYNSIIQSGCIIAVIWPHPVLKMLRTKLNLSEASARRVVLLICCTTVAATWIIVGFFHHYQLVLFFLNRCMQNGIDVIMTSTLMLNYSRAGLSSIAFSAINTVGNLSVVFSSTLVGWYLDYTGQSRSGWCMIYTTMGLVQFIVWILYATMIPVAPIEFKRS